VIQAASGIPTTNSIPATTEASCTVNQNAPQFIYLPASGMVNP